MLACDMGNATNCSRLAASASINATSLAASGSQAALNVRAARTSLLSTSSTATAHAELVSRELLAPDLLLCFFFIVLCVVGMCAYAVARAWWKDKSPEPEEHRPPKRCTLDEVNFSGVVCKDSECRHLAWCSHGSAVMLIPPVTYPPVIDAIRAPWNDTILTDVFQGQGLSAAEWSAEAKQHLANELRAGKARLVRHGGSLMRAVELVVVAVEYPPEGFVLQEASRQEPIRFGTVPERSPTTRRRRDESVFDAARRTLASKVGFPSDSVQVNEYVLGVTDFEEVIGFYPDLQCVARKFLVKATVAEIEPNSTDQIGITSGSHQAEGANYEWVPKTHLKWFPKRGSRRASQSLYAGLDSHGLKCPTALDALPDPIQPWTEKTVVDTLESHLAGNAEDHFGVSVQSLVIMLNKGEFYFGVDQADMKLLCVRDYVCLGTTAADGRVVVQKTAQIFSTSIEKYNLPATVRLPDENIWCAARRIAHSYFGNVDITERVCVQELPPEQAEPKGLLKVLQSGQPTSNMMHRVFVVAAKISVTSSDFKPSF